jgi:hypothetical protein
MCGKTCDFAVKRGRIGSEATASPACALRGCVDSSRNGVVDGTRLCCERPPRGSGTFVMAS